MSYVRKLKSMIILSGALAFAGCSSTTAEPEPSAAAPASAEAKTKVDSAKTTESTTKAPASSSLEALQRGESTATPASSPLKDVYFDFDRYDLREDAREILKANSAWLKANPAAQVQIEGHCDERGTTEYNVALGSRRAESAKDYLVTLGTSADHLSTISYGEEVPVCREQTEECWQKNRRVRFVVQPGRPTT
ncbi:MAG TPA: peptidoglycan-associated lipoprotein Pal [Candidatus Binatia bacterium]|jgi:peptidoglycan-associated lipoprotein